jgi:hypothetical protein
MNGRAWYRDRRADSQALLLMISRGPQRAWAGVHRGKCGVKDNGLGRNAAQW